LSKNKVNIRNKNDESGGNHRTTIPGFRPKSDNCGGEFLRGKGDKNYDTDLELSSWLEVRSLEWSFIAMKKL